VARWRIRLTGDLTPVYSLTGVSVQSDGTILTDMSQAELISHFDLLPSLGLELVSVEQIRDDNT
jgi:hypothetical protein